MTPDPAPLQAALEWFVPRPNDVRYSDIPTTFQHAQVIAQAYRQKSEEVEALVAQLATAQEEKRKDVERMEKATKLIERLTRERDGHYTDYNIAAGERILEKSRANLLAERVGREFQRGRASVLEAVALSLEAHVFDSNPKNWRNAAEAALSTPKSEEKHG